MRLGGTGEAVRLTVKRRLLGAVRASGEVIAKTRPPLAGFLMLELEAIVGCTGRLRMTDCDRRSQTVGKLLEN